jgi:hypothetical protein
MMPVTTITFHVDDAERAELLARADREKVNLSDYIRVRLGLRAQGGEADLDVQGEELLLRKRVEDHEQRLHALEEELARRRED